MEVENSAYVTLERVATIKMMALSKILSFQWSLLNPCTRALKRWTQSSPNFFWKNKPLWIRWKRLQKAKDASANAKVVV